MATPHRTSLTLPGADGGPLRVEVRRQGGSAPRPAVVMCHGFKGFMAWGFFPVLADRLARAGLAAVSFNFSGSGVADGDTFAEPDRFSHATLSGDVDDLETVWSAAHEGRFGPIAADRLGLFGHSRGGGVAILFAARHRLGALVTWNAIGHVDRWGEETIRRWRQEGTLPIENARTGQVIPLSTDLLDDIERNRERLDIAAAASRLTAPWLDVRAGEDIVVPPEEAPPGATETLIVPGGNHTFGARHPWAGSTAELDRAMDRTMEWFVERLAG
jgi:pimeloyl-ACP methyl ester carboxylesterase